jgi:4-hydroxybenzoate polyprenyltransferase
LVVARWLDALVFSSAWVAAAAAALCAAAAAALGAAPQLPVFLLAACGTFAIYNLDRLRDLERDRLTAPERSAFVASHRVTLLAGSGLAATAAVALGVRLGAPVVALLAPVLLAGLLHRRLKRFGGVKPVYIAFAWTLVTVGLPAVAAGATRHLAWVAALVFGTVFANAVASNLRDGEAIASRLAADAPLWLARGGALASLLLGLSAPAPLRPLALLPAALLLALVRFRAEERYGLWIVDGALLVGALAALPLL